MRFRRNTKVTIVAVSTVAALIAMQTPAEATVGAIYGPSCAGNGDYAPGGDVAFPVSVTPGKHSCYYAQVRIKGFNPNTGVERWYYGEISHYESYLNISNGDYLEAYQGRVGDYTGTFGAWTNLVHL